MRLTVIVCATVLVTAAAAQDPVFTPPIPKSAKKAPAKSTGTSRPVTSLAEVHKIYVDSMENNLDQYVKAEIMKQFKGRLTIVTSPDAADGIMTGVSEQEKGTGAKITGKWLGLHDVATGSVTVLDRSGKNVLWVEEAGDRSLVFGMVRRGGQRKVADRLVHKLKKAMGV
jgi:hypothetical protein